MRFYRLIAVFILSLFLIGCLSGLQARQVENAKRSVIENIEIIDEHHILYDNMIYWYE